MTQVCYVDLSDFSEDQLEALYELSSPERQSRADRYLRREDRHRSLAADALLRHAMAQALGRSDYPVAYMPKGKPYVKDRPDFHFNLTHSGRWVAIAWGREPVGLDVEQLRFDAAKEGIARRFFCQNEYQYIFEAEGEQRCRRFFEIWTKKESYIKYTGTGLAQPLNSFSVLNSPEPKLRFHCGFLEDAAYSLCTPSQWIDFTRLTPEQL
jgi:4'-phosphopantetheinyl transferase